MHRIIANTLLLTSVLLVAATTANAEEVNTYRWVNNNHNLAVVMARSHDTKFALAENCAGNVVLSMFDFTNYNAASLGKYITFKWRVDKGKTYSSSAKVQETEDNMYAIRIAPDAAGTAALRAGNTLRIVYKLPNDKGYGGMEEYTLRGLTTALNRASDSCADGSSEYFDLSNEGYF